MAGLCREAPPPTPVSEPVEKVLKTQSHTRKKINIRVFSRPRAGRSAAWTLWACEVPGVARSGRRFAVGDRDRKRADSEPGSEPGSHTEPGSRDGTPRFITGRKAVPLTVAA